MNLSDIGDWLWFLGVRKLERKSSEEDINEDTKNDYSCRTNHFVKETTISKSMSANRKKGNSSRGKIFANSSSKVHPGFCTKVNDLKNSRQDSNLNTIQSWLYRFEKPTILPALENSLEQVKRNKCSIESHEKLSKSIDKELQKLSITFHPDRAGDTEWQAALNAIRVVLKTLTEIFLENIFIDYKYEYFSRLDVRVLVNENERNNTIQTIFYKISVFSETKRMNIIGEIRKFLIESEKCVKSFLENNERDFLKFRDYSLYHLRKNIEGYKKLQRECNLLIEECSNENGTMKTVVQNMVDQSLTEWAILTKLERTARSSVEGNFEIFSVENNMDEYYILPFVDYVNVLSMCNLLLQPPKLRFFRSSSKVESFSTDDNRNHFIKAYILAYDIYRYKLGLKNARETLAIDDFSQELRKTLGIIFREILQKDYTVDVYREGKSNRAEMYEKLLSVKNILKDLEEKEKTFGDSVRQYQMERNVFPERVLHDRQDDEKRFKVDVTNEEKESGEDSRKLTSPLETEKNQYKMETKNFSESILNGSQGKGECVKVDMENREKRNEESRKLTSPLEGEENQEKVETKECCESVLNCRQNEKESYKINRTKREKESEGYSSDLSSLSEEEKTHEGSQEYKNEDFVFVEVGKDCLNLLDY